MNEHERFVRALREPVLRYKRRMGQPARRSFGAQPNGDNTKPPRYENNLWAAAEGEN